MGSEKVLARPSRVARVPRSFALLRLARRAASAALAGALLSSAASPALARPQARSQEAGSPSPEAVKEATEHFLKGKKLFAAKQYAEALVAFEASYATVKSPNSMLYVARSHAALGDDLKAWRAFNRVVAEASTRAEDEAKYKPTFESAKVEREEVEKRIGLVTVRVLGKADATLHVAGEEIPPGSWHAPVPVEPGEVEVVVTPAGRPPVRKTESVAAGERREITVDASEKKPAVAEAPPPPEPPRPPPGPLRPAAYVAGGVGLVGLGVFIVGGIMTNSTYATLTKECGEGSRCPERLRDDVDAGRTQQTIANVGLAVGVVGLAAGAGLFVLSQPGSGKSTGAAPSTRLVVGAGSARLEGRF